MPRAKRSKQYRKLMDQFSMSFGFREPYQVLVDADFLAEANKCKMEIVRRFEDTLHARQIKPMITQCSMRHLYARKSEPGVPQAIDMAKEIFERRRCGHHPDDYPEPLSNHDCIMSVVDPKSSASNKHRYVCAINDDRLRQHLRSVAGVPLIYIRRSVVLMEPMADATQRVRMREERQKFRAEIKAPLVGKRKREEDDNDDDAADGGKGATPEQKSQEKKKNKGRGPKGPNPLSVKKKKQPTTGPPKKDTKPTQEQQDAAATTTTTATTTDAEGDAADQAPAKKKRKRKGKKGSAGDADAASTAGDGENHSGAES